MIVRSMIVAQHIKAKAAGVASVVRAPGQTRYRVVPAFINMAAGIDEKMIADVAPTVAIHVQVLHATHFDFASLKAGGPVAGSSGVMNDGAIQGTHARAGCAPCAPAGASADAGLRSLSSVS